MVEHKNKTIQSGNNPVRNEFTITKDPNYTQEHSQGIPCESTMYQAKQFDSELSQSHLTMAIETGQNLEKTQQICSEHVHSHLEGSDTLGDTKPNIIQEHLTPHEQDIIGVVYESATTKVLKRFL